MRRTLALAAGAVFVLGLAGNAGAVPTTYLSEADYLADLSLVTSTTIFEGFEGSDWNGVRSPASATSVTSQGLTWTASDDVSTTSGWARTGNWGVFDTFGDPDNLFSTHTSMTLVGFGGWFNQTTATDLSLYLDGQLAGGIPLSGRCQRV